jgi:hypothetical protein
MKRNKEAIPLGGFPDRPPYLRMALYEVILFKVGTQNPIKNIIKRSSLDVNCKGSLASFHFWDFF